MTVRLSLIRLNTQLSYVVLKGRLSILHRGVEGEHLPLGRSAGMGLVPWSPLAYSLLTGRCDRATVEASGSRKGVVPNQGGAGIDTRPEGDKRLDGDNPFGDTLFTDPNWHIVGVLKRVAEEAGESASR